MRKLIIAAAVAAMLAPAGVAMAHPYEGDETTSCTQGQNNPEHPGTIVSEGGVTVTNEAGHRVVLSYQGADGQDAYVTVGTLQGGPAEEGDGVGSAWICVEGTDGKTAVFF